PLGGARFADDLRTCPCSFPRRGMEGCKPSTALFPAGRFGGPQALRDPHLSRRRAAGREIPRRLCLPKPLHGVRGQCHRVSSVSEKPTMNVLLVGSGGREHALAW